MFEWTEPQIKKVPISVLFPLAEKQFIHFSLLISLSDLLDLSPWSYSFFFLFRDCLFSLAFQNSALPHSYPWLPLQKHIYLSSLHLSHVDVLFLPIRYICFSLVQLHPMSNCVRVVGIWVCHTNIKPVTHLVLSFCCIIFQSFTLPTGATNEQYLLIDDLERTPGRTQR